MCSNGTVHKSHWQTFDLAYREMFIVCSGHYVLGNVLYNECFVLCITVHVPSAVCVEVCSAVFCIQEELYAHLEAVDMEKVQEQVKAKREWLETNMQACQASPKHVNAPVSSTQIQAEAKVSMFILDSNTQSVV